MSLLLQLACVGPLKEEVSNNAAADEALLKRVEALEASQPTELVAQVTDLQTRLAAAEATIGELTAANEAQDATIGTLESALAAADSEAAALEARIAALETTAEQHDADLVSLGLLLDQEVLDRGDADDAEAVARAAAVTSLTSSVSGIDGRVSAIESDYLTSGDYSDLDGRLGDIEGAWVWTDTTVNVPSDFATLEDALAWLDTVRIGPAAEVEILLASGSYTMSGAIDFRHPDGDRVHIVGDGLGAQLNFSGTSGIVVHEGGRLYLENLVIDGDDTTGTLGLAADFGGMIFVDTVTVSDFAYGFSAQDGGILQLAGATASSNTFGFVAVNDGYVYAPSAVATGNTSYGYYAGNGGGLYGRYSGASGGQAGYRGYLGSWLDVQNSSSSGATYAYFITAGVMEAANSSAVSATTYSAMASQLGFLSFTGGSGTSAPCVAHAKGVVNVNSTTIANCTLKPSYANEPYTSSSPTGYVFNL